MQSDRWSKVNQLFHAALEKPPDEWTDFLKVECAQDMQLQKEVESLLAAHQKGGKFIQKLAITDPASLLSDAEELLISGQQIGSYKIVKEIGRGGMGAVYLATRADELFTKYVAIKLIKRGMDTDDVLRHFRIERQILGNFDHPNIARLLDGGSTDSGLPYFVMEYVEGKPIDEYCDERCLSITERLELFLQVCAAVSYAHRNLVVHRDLKPSNILITNEGIPKLLDFGIAKILQTESAESSTATGLLMMTPEYASPEQAQGLPVTTLSDVYSLGVILYELLTGHDPYPLTNRSTLEIARTISETQPKMPSTIVDPDVCKTREGTPERLQKRLRGDVDSIILMALRKESERRYQSVDQFSDDIKRHLDGLPITARKDLFLYRTAKFLNRNKVAVAITALALLTIAISTGFIQWRANRQARLIQEFAQQVTRIEALMRYAYLLPLHNIQPEKKEVEQRLSSIEQKMQAIQGIAFGPGHYSLGRCYISLHRYQDAYDQLKLAWGKYNYHEPDVANALGLSLAMLYRDKLQETEQLYGKAVREKRKKDLEKQYRDPAFHFIQNGKSSSGSEPTEYINALLDFLSKQYPDALKKADFAAEKASWFYEARLLQGDIFAAMGNDQRDVGKTEVANNLYQKAKEAYLLATNKGQSDPQGFERLCSVETNMLQILAEKELSNENIAKDGVNYCEKALQADSSDLMANVFISKIYWFVAHYQQYGGSNPLDSYDKAIKYADAAIKIDPENGFANLVLGNAYNIRAQIEIQKQGNAIPFLELAEAALGKASSKMPEDHELLGLRGNNYCSKAMAETLSGKNPISSLEKAITLLKKARDLDPKNARYYGILGMAYVRKGLYERMHGIDPNTSLKQSLEFSKKSIEINPSLVASYTWAGAAYLQLADYEDERGENPINALDGAISIYQRSLLVNPGESNSLSGLGGAFYRKARFLQKEGNDPSVELESARKAYRQSLEKERTRIVAYAYFAEVELVAARNAMAHHKSPEPFFKSAQQIINDCYSINPSAPDCLESQVALDMLRAKNLVALGKRAEIEIKKGTSDVERLLKTWSDDALAHIYHGELLLLRAQTSSGELRKKAAHEAEDAFQQAFKVQNTLRREYGNDCEEAKRLVTF